MHLFDPAPVCRRRLLTALLSAAALPSLAVSAGNAWSQHGLATLEIFDRDSGRVLPTYAQGGRTWAPGRPGARYALRLRNLSAGRVLVVLSVDGVNVISGETADWQQTGYVLDPGRRYDINGWRKSDSEVAAFEFAPIDRSYAARTGRPAHVGVIGMAVFRERTPMPPPLAAAPAARADDRGESAAASGTLREKSAAEDNAGSRLGTGHGPREWSASTRTTFERASSRPDQVVRLDYDSAERLIAAGVIPSPSWHARPNPFPSSEPGYVPDPPRW